MANVATRQKTAQDRAKAPAGKERTAAERLEEIDERCKRFEERLAVLAERAGLLEDENNGLRRALRSVRAVVDVTLNESGE